MPQYVNFEDRRNQHGFARIGTPVIVTHRSYHGVNALKGVRMPETHNVFISHRHEDDHLVADFKRLLEGRNVQIRDASITSDTPNDANNEDYIKSEILAPGIQWAGKIVVIITPDTCNHPWVDWEIEYAETCGDKQIIGVWAPGDSGCEVPEPLERHADAIVSWNADKIIEALNGDPYWEQSDGTARGPQPVNRIGCR